MAKGKKTGGRNFEPGQVTNPAGKKPLSDAEKAARDLVRDRVYATVGKAYTLTVEQYDALDKSDMTVGELAIIDAYVKKNYQAIKIYEDRLLGKAKESVELTGEDGGGIHLVINSAFLPMVDSNADQP